MALMTKQPRRVLDYKPPAQWNQRLGLEENLRAERAERERRDREYLARLYAAHGEIPPAQYFGESVRQAAGDVRSIPVEMAAPNDNSTPGDASVLGGYLNVPGFDWRASGGEVAINRPARSVVEEARRVLEDPKATPEQRMRAWAALGITGDGVAEVERARGNPAFVDPLRNPAATNMWYAPTDGGSGNYARTQRFGPMPWQVYTEVTPPGGREADTTRPAVGAVYNPAPYGAAGNDAALYRALLGLGMSREGAARMRERIQQREWRARSFAAARADLEARRADREAERADREAERQDQREARELSAQIERYKADASVEQARILAQIRSAEKEEERKAALDRLEQHFQNSMFSKALSHKLALLSYQIKSGDQEVAKNREVLRSIVMDVYKEIKEKRPTDRIPQLVSLGATGRKMLADIIGIDAYRQLLPQNMPLHYMRELIPSYGEQQ